MNKNSARHKIKSLPLISSFLKRFRKTQKRKRMISFYRQFINRDDLCFDIGANEGLWSEVFLSLKASVIAIEPQSACVESMMKKFPNEPAIKIIHTGVGSKEEMKELKVAANKINSTFSDTFIEKYKHFDYASWPSSEIVQVTTLDNLISRYGLPTFCKIDAEGFELEIVKGLSRPIHFIQLEYVPPFRSDIIECINLLRELGNARFNYSSYENMKLELKEWIGADEMKSRIQSFPDDFLVGDIIVEFLNTE